MDGERPVPRHFRDNVAVRARGVDHYARIDGAAVGVHRSDDAALYVHALHDGVERHFGAILNGVLRKGDGHLVG